MVRYAIFVDIDGTLIDENGVNILNNESIKKARQMGHFVFVNTGRAKSYITPEVLGNIEFDGIISGIGSRIDLMGKTIYERYIEQNFVYDAVKHFWNTKNCFLISGAEKRFVLNPLPRYFSWNFEEIVAPEDFLGRYAETKIQKFEMFGEYIPKIDKEFFDKHLAVYEYGEYFEATRCDSTKASAMDKVLKYLNIKRENSIAIGDSANDEEMLKNAGIAVAMGNAPKKVKNLADFVSIKCKDGGVGYAIEKLVLNK